VAAEGVGVQPASEHIRDLVTAHQPRDERERASMHRMLAELEHLDAPCDERTGPVHVTASAVVVGPRGTLLHLHRRLDRWMQPGGHIEPGEEPWEAACREVAEETGMAVRHPPGGPRLLHVDVHQGAKGHTHLDLRYLVVADDVEPSPPPGESQQVRWCSWSEAEQLADDALVGALTVAHRQWDEELVGA
jgi:8-oxo-dGTP pyrophosphatase MutT (NUDIX family)